MWVALTLDQRARLLGRVRDAVGAVAQEWADTATMSKGLEPGHPYSAEEWLGGPYAVIGLLDALRETLEALAKGRSPLDGVMIDQAPGGRLRAHTFPLNGTEKFLLSGFTGEVWFEPGVTADQARHEAGLAQLTPTESGGVGLVLGAGNVTSIPVADVLYELFAHNRVALLKVNPTQDALVPVFERALAPLIEPGLVRIVRGGAATGAYLTSHPRIAHVHITGSAPTFDAIVWGGGTDADAARAAGEPRLKVPITAELGGVSPIIVVPGALVGRRPHVPGRARRDDAARERRAQLHRRAGRDPEFGLAAAGRVPAGTAHGLCRRPRAPGVVPPQRRAARGRGIRVSRRRLVRRPHPRDRRGARAATGPDPVESVEYFAPILGVVEVGGTGQEFLDAAVAHANDRLTGTLGANVLIDPATEQALGDGFERAMADLRYGDIAINTWTAFNFLTARLTWGGYPGATPADVSSGIGVVHNALLLDRRRAVGRVAGRSGPSPARWAIRSGVGVWLRARSCRRRRGS